MLIKFIKKEDKAMEALDKAIISATNEVIHIPMESEDYDKALITLERLHQLRNKGSRKISPDTLAMVAGNLLGIALIINHERAEVITTKALGFVLKGRV